VIRRIACLHTGAGNVAIFEAAKPEGVTLSHTVREDLLHDAIAAGGLTPAIAERTVAALEELRAADVDAVLLTCSTLGPVAKPPVQRVDAALAEAASRDGGQVVVLVAVQSTVASTRALFAAAAARHGASLEVRLVPAAWDAFRAGDFARYAALVAAAAEAAFAEGATQVALAQASMAPAAALCRGRRPLTSPDSGLAAALA
jgi:DNA-binding MurR/RpiR family transcriptional regulator